MTTPADSPPGSGPSAGKGRPTPKRSEAARRRGGPVAPPPQTRKEAAKRQREQKVLARTQVKTGRVTGERPMIARDAGPVRAAVRDVVDGRRNIGVVLLPLALVLIVAQIINVPAIISIALALWLTTLIAVTVDLVVTGTQIRRRVKAEWPQEGKVRGHVAYGLLRSTVLRRFRQPPPRVAPAG